MCDLVWRGSSTIQKPAVRNRKFQFRSRAAFVFCLLLFLSKTAVDTAHAQSDKGDSQNKTLFLVAHPELPILIFKESVVLMFPPSVGAANGVVVGLIVNKPARVALSEIFPNDKALKNRSETVYFGGPVDPRAPGVVFRSSKAVKQAALLFGDVYVSFDRDFIKELLKEPEKTPGLRLFVGNFPVGTSATPKRDGYGSVVQRVCRDEPDIQR